MNYIKETTISELKRDHSERHGFALHTDFPINDEKIEGCVQLLKNANIIKENPVLATRLNGVFVMVFGPCFDHLRFWQSSSLFCRMTNIKMEPLCFFLNGEGE